MRKLALIMSTFGFIAFAGLARADQKTENSEKVESGTTLGGKHKTTRTKTVERADGSSVESKTETTRPKTEERRDLADRRDVEKRDMQKRDIDESKRDIDENKRDVDTRRDNGVEEKTEHHTTLTGKKQTKTIKKMDNADGSHTETTTTTTEPDKK